MTIPKPTTPSSGINWTTILDIIERFVYLIIALSPFAIIIWKYVK